MVQAIFYLPTSNLLIRRSLNELVQAALYRHLPDKEHEGYKSSLGKRFKKMVFRAIYTGHTIKLSFDSLNHDYKERIAKAILLGDFSLGAIHVSRTELSVIDRTLPKYITSIEVSSTACAMIRDQMGKLIYLEPRDSRFIQIIRNNAIEKYETLLGRPYTGELTFTILWQRNKPITIHYDKAHHICYPSHFRIEGTNDMLNLLIQTGMGAKIMQGCGWVDLNK